MAFDRENNGRVLPTVGAIGAAFIVGILAKSIVVGDPSLDIDGETYVVSTSDFSPELGDRFVSEVREVLNGGVLPEESFYQIDFSVEDDYSRIIDPENREFFSVDRETLEELHTTYAVYEDLNHRTHEMMSFIESEVRSSWSDGLSSDEEERISILIDRFDALNERRTEALNEYMRVSDSIWAGRDI